MFCPNCGREIYLKDIYFGLDNFYCERCNHEFWIKDEGKVSEEEMARVRRDFQAKFEKTVKGIEPPNVTFNRIEKEQ